MKATLTVIACIAGIFLLAILGEFVGFGVFDYFAPKYEESKRKVFHNSKEYVDGTIQELDKMRLEYAKTKDADVRAVLEDRALRLVAEFDRDNLPDSLRAWIYELENKATSVNAGIE